MHTVMHEAVCVIFGDLAWGTLLCVYGHRAERAFPQGNQPINQALQKFPLFSHHKFWPSTECSMTMWHDEAQESQVGMGMEEVPLGFLRGPR